MEGLLCLSKPSKEYAVLEFQPSPSENNNGDTGTDDPPPKASLSGKLSSASMTSVGSISSVSNKDLKDFLEQMKWHINNKLDNTRIEMMELRKKVNSMDEKLKVVLGDKDGSCDHGNQDVENGVLDAEDDKGAGDGEGGGGSTGGGGKGGIRRGSGSLAKSIKGVFMNSNNNKLDKHSNGGGSSIKSDKQTNGGSIPEEEEVEKRKTVTFGQDVVVKEFQRVFSGKKRSKKGQKVMIRQEVPEEDEEEAEAEMNGQEGEQQDEIQKGNGNAEEEDSDDFTDSEEETESREATLSASKGSSIDLAKEREASWRISKSVDGANEYQNTTIGGKPPEDFYEIPVAEQPPALPPTLSRPPIKRVVDEHEDFYEDPDDQESGRGSMPPGSCSDEGSGNTFVFPHKGDKTDHQIEEDFNSDSTDYEDVEDVDLELQIQEKQKKPKVDKLEEFKNEHRCEEDIDLIDRLLMLNNFFSTIKSVGKWEKRYCIAKDGQLFIYKSYKDKQSKAQRLPLMGYTVFLLGQQGKQENVIKIEHHNLKPPLLLASESADVSNKWVAVLHKYSTINHTIVPGGQPDDDDVHVEDTHEKRKGPKLFSKEKKDGTPQLTIDGDILSGYVNIYGARYGEAKIRRKWITLQDMVFSCSATKDDVKMFSFSIRGIDVAAADKKEVKMKGAFKLSKDGEVFLYIEALNMLDAGHLLKKLVSASMNTAPKATPEGRPASSSVEESGMVARLLASFETTASDQTDSSQRRFSTVSQQSSLSTLEETYDDIELSPFSEENYENNTVKSPPPDTSERRKKFADKFKFNRSRQSTVEEQGVYEDTVSPTSSRLPEDIYDDVDAPPLPPPDKMSIQKKTMSLPSEDQIPAVFEDLYLEVLSDTDARATTSTAEASLDTAQSPSLPQAPSTPQSRIKNFKLPNFKVKKDKEKEKEVISPTESAPGEKKETEKERKQREKKEKKEEKKKKEKDDKKKDKKKKKEREASEEAKEAEDVAPPTPTSPSSCEVSEKKDEIKKPSPALQRKASAPPNKFKDSNMSHLLVKDKLMQDRKELETQKKELSTRRGDLRAKKMSSSDAVEKEKVQKEIDVVQKELSELSKKLVQIAGEIEDATGDNTDANANRTSGTAAITKRTSVRASSPDREKVSKGTVSDRMKMFQQDK